MCVPLAEIKYPTIQSIIGLVYVSMVIFTYFFQNMFLEEQRKKKQDFLYTV